MKKKTNYLNFLILVIILTTSFNLLTLKKTSAEEIKMLSVDFNTGLIYKKQGDINQKNKVASVSKLITHYIIFEKIQNGEIDPNKKIKISQEIASFSVEPLLSNVILDSTQEYTIDELLKASVVASANAATTALAIEISGSENKFIEEAIKKAKLLGLENFTLINTTGLSNDLVPVSLQNKLVPINAENEFSAIDLARIVKKMYQTITI
jgi:D-alanyl-D-alanine carboxypeptidase (penicillin-binding protein 5/6)